MYCCIFGLYALQILEEIKNIIIILHVSIVVSLISLSGLELSCSLCDATNPHISSVIVA